MNESTEEEEKEPISAIFTREGERDRRKREREREEGKNGEEEWFLG